MFWGVGIMSYIFCFFSQPLSLSFRHCSLSLFLILFLLSCSLSPCHHQCQSCETLPGRIIGTHICSRCNLVFPPSDKYFEWKLIIVVGCEFQREGGEWGECVFNPNFERVTSSPPLQSHVRGCPRPAWKGLAYSMWSFLERALALHRKQIHRGERFTL